MHKFPNSEKTAYGYKDLLASVDTVIMGGRTYHELQCMDIVWPYPNQHTYAVSRHEWDAKEESVSFITENIIEQSLNYAMSQVKTFGW